MFRGDHPSHLAHRPDERCRVVDVLEVGLGLGLGLGLGIGVGVGLEVVGVLVRVRGRGRVGSRWRPG